MIPQRPSRLSVTLLRLVLSPQDLETVLGDIEEEALARSHQGRLTVAGRLSVEWLALRYLMACLGAGMNESVRSFGRIVRSAFWSLVAAPATSLPMFAILTVGLAAAIVTYSVVDAVVFKPLPFPDSNQLVVVTEHDPASPWETASLSAFEVRGLSRVNAFGALAGVHRTQVTIDQGARPTVVAANVDASLFQVLGIAPIAGRVLTADDQRPGHGNVVVIGYGLWRRLFDGSPSAVGQVLPIVAGDTTMTGPVIVGVMPEGFAYPLSEGRRAELWRPFVMHDDERDGVNDGHYLQSVARMRRDTSLRLAQNQLDAATPSMTAPGQHQGGVTFRATPLDESLAGDVGGWMRLAFWAVVIMVLSVCANVANLHLARSTRRVRELAIRLALGATRRHIVTSLLVESMLVSIAATAAALLIALWGVDAARAALPEAISRADEIALNRRVLVAASLSAFGAGLLAGLVPAWLVSRHELVTKMRLGASLTHARSPWRSALIVGQMALVMVLLVSTTFVVLSFVRVVSADLGFSRENLLVLSGQAVTQDGIPTTTQRLRGLPGVVSVAAVQNGSPPLIAAGFDGGASGMRIRRGGSSETVSLQAEFRRVSPDYFAVAGIALLRGHLPRAAPSSLPPVVIDEAVAAALFGGRDPLGQEVLLDRARVVTGVAARIRSNGPEGRVPLQVYLPLNEQRGADFVVRVSTPPDTAAAVVRRALVANDAGGDVNVLRVLRVEDAFRNITAGRRLNAGIMSFFGLIALLVGAAGVYGVVTSMITQERRDIGVRIALGATAGRVTRDVLSRTSRHLAVSAAIGIPCAWWVTRGLSSLLFEVQASDVSPYMIALAIVSASGIAAAWVPARRASRLDPLVALRAE